MDCASVKTCENSENISISLYFPVIKLELSKLYTYSLLRDGLACGAFLIISCVTEVAGFPPFCLRCQSRHIAYLKKILQELCHREAKPLLFAILITLKCFFIIIIIIIAFLFSCAVL